MDVWFSTVEPNFGPFFAQADNIGTLAKVAVFLLIALIWFFQGITKWIRNLSEAKGGGMAPPVENRPIRRRPLPEADPLEGVEPLEETDPLRREVIDFRRKLAEKGTNVPPPLPSNPSSPPPIPLSLPLASLPTPISSSPLAVGPSETVRTNLRAAELAEAIRNPNEIRKGVLLSEILKRKSWD